MPDKVTRALCWDQSKAWLPWRLRGGTCEETLLALGFAVVPAPALLPSVCRAISVCLKHPGSRPTQPRAESKAYVEIVSSLRVSLWGHSFRRTEQSWSKKWDA